MKSLPAIGMFVLMLALAGCSNTANTADANGSTQIANPFTEYENASEAAEAAGFSIDTPESIGTYGSRTYRVMNAGADDAMVEVVYNAVPADASDDELSEQNYCIRKAAGSGDVSGDSTDYTEESTYVDDAGVEYNMRGDDGLIYLVIWEKDGYAFSLGAYDGASIAPDDVAGIVARIY